MKTDETKRLEDMIYNATHKQGVFCCFEVTIGWFGKERVDYMTYDTKGMFRCYEIKVTKSDFHSPCHNSFVGHYNYYILPASLYEEVKEEIPDWIGIYVDRDGWLQNVRKAKRRLVAPGMVETLKNSMIRSLARESDKARKSENVEVQENLKRTIRTLEREKQQEYRRYWDLLREVEALYGTHWRHPPGQQDGEAV